MGGSILVSIDGGLSWHKLQVGSLNFAVFNEDKIYNSHAITVGYYEVVAIIATQQSLPILRKAAFNFNPGKLDTLSLQIEPRKASCGDKGLLITVLAESHHQFIDEQQPLKMVGKKSITQLSDEAMVTYDIPVTLAASLGAKGIGANPGDLFWYAVKLTCDGWTVQYPVEAKGATSQVYIPWYTRLLWWHWLMVTLTGFALLAVMVFLIRPIWIADYYRVSTQLGPFAETKLPLLDMKLGELLQIFNLWVVLLLVRQPRVLDAWVNKHAEAWKAHFENLATVKRCRDYLALPCMLDWDGDEQITPTVELVDRLFDKQSRLVEVVGVGGAGKTMLTIQLCRWAMEAIQQRGSVRRLPLLIEEDCNHDNNKLLDIVQRRLKSLDIEEDEIFLRHLLKKGRLMLVFDRLSERALSTVEYIQKINGIFPLGALLISTRYSFEYEGCLLKRIIPVPLDPERMMGLMTTLLSQRSNKNSFSTFKEQTDLAQKLAEMIQHDGHELKLTPLLVTLFVQRAVKLVDEGKPLNDLPASIPEAYFTYLRDINPKDKGENRLSDDQMLRAAKALARLSLGKNFVPQDFPLEEGQAALMTVGWPDFDKVDPIKRLVINGVIVIRASAARDMIAFTLDPVAEYLAAAALIEESEHEPDGRAKMFEKVRRAGQSAKGFLFSLQQTVKLYKKPK